MMVIDLQCPLYYIGLAAGICALTEIPALFCSGAIVKKCGEFTMFLVMFLGYAVRFLAYAFLTKETTWIALPLEVTHIFCFAFFYAALTRFAAIIAPPGTSATVQAIVHTSYFGIGLGLGAVLFAFIYQQFGHFIAFIVYAIASATAFVILLLLYVIFLRKLINKMKDPERMGSFSPHLSPEPHFVDEDSSADYDFIDDNSKSPLPVHSNPTSPHYGDL